MSKSTARSRRRKADRPKRPYPEFPLTPHASGKWMKKIRGRIHYFGRWARVINGKLERVEGDGWKGALERYKVQADDLHAGRTPRVRDADGITVADLCNRFLTAKLRKRDSGEMGPRMFVEYKEITDLLVATFGARRLVDDLAADDFEQLRAVMAQRWGPVRLGNAITRVSPCFGTARTTNSKGLPRDRFAGSGFVRFEPVEPAGSAKARLIKKASDIHEKVVPSKPEDFRNGTYHEVDGIDLGKLPAGDYTVKWIINLSTFEPGTSPRESGCWAELELRENFTVRAAKGPNGK